MTMSVETSMLNASRMDHYPGMFNNHNRITIHESPITNHQSQMARFNWSDPLLLDQQLTEEERLVRDTARAYAQDKLAPRVLESFRHEHTDPAIFRELGALDMLGVTIPEQYGGAGLGYVSYGLVA